MEGCGEIYRSTHMPHLSPMERLCVGRSIDPPTCPTCGCGGALYIHMQAAPATDGSEVEGWDENEVGEGGERLATWVVKDALHAGGRRGG